MESGDKRYTWQQSDWPNWVYDHSRLAPLLARVHLAQGRLLGRMEDLGLAMHDQACMRVPADLPRFWFVVC